jgi:hypothetical protein
MAGSGNQRERERQRRHARRVDEALQIMIELRRWQDAFA